MDGLFYCFGLFLVIPSFVLSIVAIFLVLRLKNEVWLLRQQAADGRAPRPFPAPPETSPDRVASYLARQNPAPASTPPPPAPPPEPPVLTPFYMERETPPVETSIPPAPPESTPQPSPDATPAPGVAPAPEPVGSAPTLPPSEPASAPHIPPAPPLQPKPAMPLEQRLIRLAVGVGGIALALAGIFLVKVAFSHNFLNPTIRVIIGALFGAALLAAGVLRRHKEPNIAQALSAAGIADLFACFLAATNLYHLLPPAAGFVLLAATTALAVFLSLRQGPFVAFLGLIGGFLTPALIHTGHPSALSLFGYLFLLHLGLITVTRARQWAWIAALTVLASLGWVVLWLLTQPWNPADAPVLGAFLLLSTAVVAIGSAFQETAWNDNPWLARTLTYVTLFLGAGLSAVLLARSDFSNTEWVFLGLLSAGCFALARLRPPYEPFAWFASTFVLLLLTAWGFARPADLPRLRIILPTFGILFSLASYGCLWRSRSPVRWTALSVISALSYTLLAYAILDHAPRPDTWVILPLSVAAAYTLLAIPILRRRDKFPVAVLSTLATGVLLALAFAPPMVLTHAPLTAVWSLLLPLTALLATRLRLNDLASLLLVFAAFLVLRLINPAILDYAAGPALFWNPLIWAYIPALVSLLAALFILERAPAPLATTRELSITLQAAIALVTFVFLTLFVHRVFHPDTLGVLTADLPERSTYPGVWLAAAFAFLFLGRRFSRPVLTTAGHLTLCLALLFVVAVQVLLFNPLWTPDNLGSTIIVNLLLYTYGLPALLAALLALWLRRRNDSLPYAQFAGIISLLLLFVLTSLEIRQAFNGPVLAVTDLDHLASSITERGTYVAAWLLLAIPLLFLGLRRHSQPLLTAGYLFAAAGLLFALFVQVLAQNPLWTHEDVGSVLIFNRLLYACGLPAIISAGLAWWLYTLEPDHARAFARFTAVMAILLAFVLVTLDVRQGFQGPFLNSTDHPRAAEMYAYSAAWGLFGTFLLVLGILLRGPILRWASLLVMLLTILKVFLFDTARLSDIFRVLSFAGLGISLILLAFLYHYFVFPRPPRAAPAAPPENPPAP